MSKEEKLIRVSNPNPFKVGLKLMHDSEITVKEFGFYKLSEDEVRYTDAISKIFKKSHLIIEDEELSIELGYATKSIASYTTDEITSLIKGSIAKIKKELDGVTEKHLVDKVIEIAKTVDDLAKNKITFLQDWSGYDFDQLIQDTEDDENKTK